LTVLPLSLTLKNFSILTLLFLCEESIHILSQLSWNIQEKYSATFLMVLFKNSNKIWWIRQTFVPNMRDTKVFLMISEVFCCCK